MFTFHVTHIPIWAHQTKYRTAGKKNKQRKRLQIWVEQNVGSSKNMRHYVFVPVNQVHNQIKEPMLGVFPPSDEAKRVSGKVTPHIKSRSLSPR